MIAIILKVLQKYSPLVIRIGLVLTIILLAFKLYNSNQEIKRQLGNYNAQVYATQFWQTKNGENVARTALINLTSRELKYTKDKEIVELKTVAKNAGIKIRKLEYMLSIKADTVFIIDSIPVEKVLINDRWVYIDTLNIGDLHIKRVQDVELMTAKYEVKYNPTIYVYVSWSKEDKWRLKNLFVPRTKTYFVDVITKDKLLNVTGVKAVVKD